MDVQLMIQSTPNPNALKFVLNKTVKTEGNFTYKSASECKNNPMAEALFGLTPAIREVFFFDNYITVTQDGSADWDDIEEKIKAKILGLIGSHDPNFNTEAPKSSQPTDAPTGPEIDKINAILDQTVRPALQMDGGDIQLMGYENKQLKVFYQGACGSCPSAAMGTLSAIENILKDQFDPDITVSMAEGAM
jgi:Fe-S cluster biogenesis protein NfuA